MKISHKILNVNNNQTIYLYITVEDIYEFGKDNLGKGENSNLLTKLREYIANNLSELKKAGVVIVINGIVIGTVTLAALYPKAAINKENINNNQVKPYTNEVVIYEQTENKKDEIIEETKAENKVVVESKKEEKEEKKEQKKENSSKENVIKKETTKKNNTNVNKTTSKNKVNNTTSNKNTKPSSNPTVNTSKTTTSTTNKTNTNNTTSKPNTNNNNNTNNNTTNTTVVSCKTIKFNNNGVTTNIDLEEYVIGVVAAEMPAAFSGEALKAQAVVARTYAMNKSSKGVTLINSTSHQVYNTTAQMKAKWGSSYSTYYNKIKSAVNATKGQVLKYNGQYIDALYYAISNGSSELPIYVWNKNYPYLQAVSSNWDKDISAGSYTVKIEYSKMSSKLKNNIDENTAIQILSKTAGNRVDKIKIGEKTYTGVEVRTALGLRSTDFVIEQNKDYVVVKTKGFGHGVGMSQYGANGAAKAGYTYKRILKHYYPGVSLVSI